MNANRKPFPWPDRPDRRSDEAPLAWCGWELPVPSAWRPLTIEGEWEKGSISMGPQGYAAFQIHWWRPGRRNFEARSWLEQRSKTLGAPRHAPAPVVASFSESLFMPDVPATTGGTQDILCGYAPQSDLMLEMAIDSGCDANSRRHLLERGLPRLRIMRRGEPVTWAADDISFESPPGFTLKQWRFDAGDLCLRLAKGNRETLVVRQVYPAEIALQHRPLEAWLPCNPFDSRPGKIVQEGPHCIQMPWRGGHVEGMRLSGKNALAFPFSRFARRRSVSMGLTDPRHGRLLLMDVESPNPWRKDDETQILMRMNWHKSSARDNNAG